MAHLICGVSEMISPEVRQSFLLSSSTVFMDLGSCELIILRIFPIIGHMVKDFIDQKLMKHWKKSWEIIQKWVWIWNFVSRESFAKSMKVLQLSESTALCDSGLDPKSIDRSIENHLGTGKGRPMADPYRLHPSKASTQWLSGTPDFPLATAVRTLLTPCFVHWFAGPTFWDSLSAFYLDRRTWSLLLQIE
jgi:hypothetical protein